MQTLDVFGVSNSPIASYIEREEVDAKFREGLDRKKHIIIFGSSKQGKTALTNKHLEESDFIRVNCAPETTVIDIFKTILRNLDITFEIENTHKTTVDMNSSIGTKAKVTIPYIAEIEGNAGVGTKSQEETQTKSKTVEYNLELSQDIAEILRKINFSKRIILENFHYLNEEIQKKLAFHLRIFEDYNILFIILGIWREKNRLAQFNGDLQDRLIEVPVEPWKKDDFIKVIKKGEKLLSVSFDEVSEQIIENSFDSIGVLQELCKECCLSANLTKKASVLVRITHEHVEKAVQKKVEDYSGRHIRSIETFMEQKTKSSEVTPLYIPYYFISYLFGLNSEDIENGLSRTDIQNGIKAIHHRPDDVRASDLSNFLHNLTSMQITKSIQPPLFDYDRSVKKLKIIDSTLYFFLRNINKDSIMDEFDKPVGI